MIDAVQAQMEIMILRSWEERKAKSHDLGCWPCHHIWQLKYFSDIVGHCDNEDKALSGLQDIRMLTRAYDFIFEWITFCVLMRGRAEQFSEATVCSEMIIYLQIQNHRQQSHKQFINNLCTSHMNYHSHFESAFWGGVCGEILSEHVLTWFKLLWGWWWGVPTQWMTERGRDVCCSIHFLPAPPIALLYI